MATKSALTTADTSLQWTAYSGQIARVESGHRRSRAGFRTSALSQEMEECAQTVTMPLGHGGDELAGVSLRIPFVRIGVGPLGVGFGIEIVEDALDPARMQVRICFTL